MSHERVFGGVREVHDFQCDGEMCDAHSRRGTFSEVWDRAKGDGWRCTKDRLATGATTAELQDEL